MKVLYSHLKKYLPDLKADAKEVANVFTMTGFMLDKFFEVENEGKKDFLLDLEVRQNRADGFGVQGLARELSAYYDIPLVIESYKLNSPSDRSLPIEVKAKDFVKRLIAVKLKDVKITNSPEWLKNYLAHYEINSVNNLVDLTNFILMETAHPSHAFDTDLSGENLTWEINPNYKKMTSLDGTEIELVPEALVVSDGKEPLALAGVVGGTNAAISNNTKNVIVEMAVYDGGLIRRNARQMRVQTEASTRLEKYMDPDSISDAFNMLISLIIEICGGEIDSAIYDNYLHPTPQVEIEVDLEKVSQIAGISISHDESKNYLKRLGFKIVDESKDIIKVTRPVNRLDIEQEEDVFEEIIRLKGFEKIPTNVLNIQATKSITPRHLTLIDNITEQLVAQGFDEVRSWILVDENKNRNANFLDWKMIKVTNSINDEVPTIRQSIAVNLHDQLAEKKKNNISNVKLFEVGKVFGAKNDAYLENYSVCILSENTDIESFRNEIEILLRSMGAENITYRISDMVPSVAHPKTCWDILVYTGANEITTIGILYLSNKVLVGECCVAEININKLDEISKKERTNSTQEITKRIVTLDANVELEKDQDINLNIFSKTSLYKNNVWDFDIVDVFPGANGRNKYTVRISYSNLSDEEAKELHGKIFKV